MTAKKIIESIDFNLWCGSDEIPTTQEDLILTKSALEKQIPKKPDFVDYNCYYFICPCCKNAIYSSSNFTDHKFCLECGQALDWSD